MKKLFLLSVAALVTFAACQKEINPAKQEAGITALTATVEQQVGDTKTALGNSNSVVWSEGDVIKVWNASNESGDFTLTEGAGTTQGTFNGDEIADPLYAFYPASAVSSVEGSVATFTLPATQHYIANTFDNGANIAVAKISGNSMQFKNVCGVLKLQLKGTTIVKSIIVKGKNNEKLNGTYTVDASASTPDMPCVTTETESEKAITLDCGDGVLLSPSKIINFYIVVPKGAFANGFEVTINDAYAASEEVKTSFANTVNRNVILSMPEKSVNIKGIVLPGVFSVSADKKVHFASGNLIATVNGDGDPIAWKFANSPISFIGNGGANLTMTSGDVDLFALPTDGSGAGEGWKPWGLNISNQLEDYYGSPVDITTHPLFASNLGIGWRMLTKDDVEFLVSNRVVQQSGVQNDARFAKIIVDNVCGILLFPDTFVWDTNSMGEVPSGINDPTAHFVSTYSLTQYIAMERSGACFINSGGRREVDTGAKYWAGTNRVDSWTKTKYKDGRGYQFYANNTSVCGTSNDVASAGRVIRLVLPLN